MDQNSKQQRLISMLNRSSLIGYAYLDAHTREAEWSAGALALLGLAPDAAPPNLGQLIGLCHPDDRAQASGVLTQALQTGAGGTFEARIRRADGVVRLLAVTLEGAMDSEGELEALCLLLRDVTEEARTERFVRTIINHLPGMIAYWDNTYVCRYANAGYSEWFGRTPDQMVGVGLRDLLGDQGYEDTAPFVLKALAGERQTFERTLTKPTGDTGGILVNLEPDHDGRGGVAGYYLMIADVTQLKRVETQLLHTNGLLEEARAEAEAAAAVKSEFLSNMSHELRSPLTSIIGFAELLDRSGSLASKDSGYLDRIKDASEILLTTINDILDFSKLEAGQVEIERRSIDPADLGRRALELFEPQTGKAGLACRFEAVGLPHRVLADDTRIRQILLNLIGNAVKFTVAGSVTLRASYDRARRRLRYEVCDTGPGIPPERMPRLFRRFSQVDGSTTRSHGGTGLGLAICRGLAEAMDGEVGVDSVLGEGSRFWVELPAEAVRKGMTSTSGDAADPSALIDTLEGLNLLIVDDNPANRELARVVSESFGIVVGEAEGGAEAIAIAAGRRFDVILLDIRMPQLDGPSTARILRSQAGPNASTPIIAFTADADVAEGADWAGLFDGCLAKPIAAMDLLMAVAQVRAGGGHRAQAAEEAVG